MGQLLDIHFHFAAFAILWKFLLGRKYLCRWKNKSWVNCFCIKQPPRGRKSKKKLPRKSNGKWGVGKKWNSVDLPDELVLNWVKRFFIHWLPFGGKLFGKTEASLRISLKNVQTLKCSQIRKAEENQWKPQINFRKWNSTNKKFFNLFKWTIKLKWARYM